jgi:dihydrolipoamide dehydrogenase
MECDVAVLGGGPGGYPAAIRAAQLGARVVLIEQGRVGGTCITVGCIPTKAWVATAHALKEAHETFAKIGVNVAGAELDFTQTQQNKDGIVSGLVNGITGVVKANGITIVQGRGVFKDDHTIAVEGQEDVSFGSAVIATGSHSLRPPVDGIDGARCVDSTSLLELTEIPERLVVMGGGVIGVEFASIMRHWGVEVTIIEMLDRLIPMEDADASKELARAFKKRDITMLLGARATAVVESKNSVTVTYQDADAKGGEVKADLVLVATGRGPSVHNIGLEAAGVKFDARTGVDVDRRMQTSVPHIYAAGDVAGQYQLAHTSFREGEIAAENALGHDAEIDYAAVPRCTYTDPEVASVGLSEAEARERYGDISVGKFPFSASARAQMTGETAGWVKTIHENRYGELVGIVIVGPQATELINAGVVGITAEATVDTLADSFTAHPTLAEGIKEAALVALGRPIHLPPPRKPKAAAAAGSA